MPYSSRANREARRKITNKPLVGKKTGILIHEGVPAKQAYATAISMVNAGRVTPEGKYRHVKRGRRG